MRPADDMPPPSRCADREKSGDECWRAADDNTPPADDRMAECAPDAAAIRVLPAGDIMGVDDAIDAADAADAATEDDAPNLNAAARPIGVDCADPAALALCGLRVDAAAIRSRCARVAGDSAYMRAVSSRVTTANDTPAVAQCGHVSASSAAAAAGDAGPS